MDKKFEDVELDERTGAEAFLGLVERQAMHNYIMGKDTDGLRVCREIERGKQKMKPIFEANELAEKTKNTKHGRSNG